MKNALDICPTCKREVYRSDKTCVWCLVNEGYLLIDSIDELIKEVEDECE